MCFSLSFGTLYTFRVCVCNVRRPHIDMDTAYARETWSCVQAHSLFVLCYLHPRLKRNWGMGEKTGNTGIPCMVQLCIFGGRSSPLFAPRDPAIPYRLLIFLQREMAMGHNLWLQFLGCMTLHLPPILRFTHTHTHHPPCRTRPCNFIYGFLIFRREKWHWDPPSLGGGHWPRAALRGGLARWDPRDQV